ncbi:helix-turn-helix transcriptional regulator [Streptococcus sp. NLN76]|uniref:helix-turn-helix domain-containing protein n=1 Tax=Streptococcus sp. NLN76 TaxID=2822800 RepID=UPI001FFCDC10|nr:helix-turn-helix transcriptional regulator [Streptococcus sp. NLN76]
MNRLKELRTEKKLTQKELAKKIGVHYRTLQNWETNETQIKPDKAQILADYFGVTAGYLLGYSDDFFNNETKELDKLLNKTVTLEDGTPVNREDFQNIMVGTEDDETLVKFGKLKLISIMGQAPSEIWDSLNDDVFRMLAVAPSEYIPLVALWSLLSPKQKTATLNLIQSFNFEEDSD